MCIRDRSRAELDFHGQDALILVGQKRRGHTPQDPARAHEHGQIYANRPHSYRDLPMRIGEIAHDFRYESSGTLKGIRCV